ncbi:MAG TPA: V-type ATP synthase subunit E [Verrucomicrobiae bacterium]|nr:V-type ATP synthase subunit E [Verrucomicrobiae bacterium]
MAAPNPNSPEILRNEILAEARREGEGILARARQDAAALLAGAAVEAGQIRRENFEQTQAEAARRRELILATVAVEAGHLRSARIESWLQAIHQATRQKLQARDGFDYRETVIALTVEALSRMTGDAFVVKLSQADGGALGNGLAEEIGRHVGRPLTVTIAAEPTSNDGGPIIQDHNGMQIWDNRFLSRLERLWPELRRQIAVATSLVARSGTSGGGA